jgi:hypothetical protein
MFSKLKYHVIIERFMRGEYCRGMHTGGPTGC